MNLTKQPQIRVIDPESEYFGDTFTVQEMSYQYKQILVTKRPLVFDFSDVQELTPLSNDGVRIGIGDEITHGPRKVTVNGFWVCEDSGVVKLHVGKCGSIWETDITDHTPLTEIKKEDEAISACCYAPIEYKTTGHIGDDWVEKTASCTDCGSSCRVHSGMPEPDTDNVSEIPEGNIGEVAEGLRDENINIDDDNPTVEDCADRAVEESNETFRALEEHDKGKREIDTSSLEQKLGDDKPTIERIDRPDPYDRHSDNMVSLDVPEVAAALIEMFEQQTEILEALADAGLINLEDNQ